MRALLLIFAACSYETESTSIVASHVVGDVCPEGFDAEPMLTNDWGPGGHEIDGAHCRWLEWLDIELIEAEPRTSCCYEWTCDAPLDAIDSGWLHDAVCLGGECKRFDLTRFTRDKAAADLAANGLDLCRVGPSPTPSDVPATTWCHYRVNARYVCEG